MHCLCKWLIFILIVTVLFVRVDAKSDNSESETDSTETSSNMSVMDWLDIINLIYAIFTLYMDLGFMAATCVLVVSIAIAVLLVWMFGQCCRDHNKYHRTTFDNVLTGFNTANNLSDLRRRMTAT